MAWRLQVAGELAVFFHNTVDLERILSNIPVIDLSNAVEGSEGFFACSKAIEQACEDTGFFGVVGHGIDPAVISGALAAARGFFALPMDEKLKVRRERPELNRAYITFGTETLARLAGNETPPDFKEVYTVGPDLYPEDEYHTCAAARPHWGPNQWPEHPDNFKLQVMAYWAAMGELTDRLTRLFARALRIPSDYFIGRMDKAPNQLRLLHYPPYDRPWEPGQLRAGAHTDLGLLTIVYSDNNAIGGLEVKGTRDSWTPVPEFDGFVVNIGDTMMRWCNDRWKSTLHRVVNPPSGSAANADRISLAFFSIPNYDTVIECLDSCTDPEHPAAYPPISMGEYRAKRFAGTANAA